MIILLITASTGWSVLSVSVYHHAKKAHKRDANLLWDTPIQDINFIKYKPYLDIMQEVINWIREVISPYMTNIVIAAIILLIGIIIGRISGRFLQKILKEIELNGILNKAANIQINAEDILSSFVTYFIYFIAAVMALSQIGIATEALNMIAAAVIIVIIISFFLGIKDFIPNFIAGARLHRKGRLKEGDKIRVKDMEGKIMHLNLVETRIMTKKGDIIYIPNTILTRYEVIKLKK